MRDPRGPSDDNVIDIATFRKKTILKAHADRPVGNKHSTIRLGVGDDGDVDCAPLQIHPDHALTLLSACIELSGHLLNVYSHRR